MTTDKSAEMALNSMTPDRNTSSFAPVPEQTTSKVTTRDTVEGTLIDLIASVEDYQKYIPAVIKYLLDNHDAKEIALSIKKGFQKKIDSLSMDSIDLSRELAGKLDRNEISSSEMLVRVKVSENKRLALQRMIEHFVV